MSFWSSLTSLCGKIDSITKHSLGYVVEKGLSDEVVKIALVWARVAAKKVLDNKGKRDFVVYTLVNKGIPESVARIATELAVNIIKRELQ